VTRTVAAQNDPVFETAPDEFPALQWHSDTYELPAGATHLAHSKAYPQQAFVYKRAYGIQFHLEVSTAMAAEWGEVPAYVQALQNQLGADALPWLIDQVARHEDEMRALAARMFGAWLERVVGLRRALPA
jgi:GMP synthase-like glutamine amidotransferase